MAEVVVILIGILALVGVVAVIRGLLRMGSRRRFVDEAVESAIATAKARAEQERRDRVQPVLARIYQIARGDTSRGIKRKDLAAILGLSKCDMDKILDELLATRMIRSLAFGHVVITDVGVAAMEGPPRAGAPETPRAPDAAPQPPQKQVVRMVPTDVPGPPTQG